ncbi:MAG TPA: hypothetical protein VJJ48_01815 [Candidatus Paceibacterota bacterium]
MLKNTIILVSALAVLLPIGIHIRDVSWGETPLLLATFPIFGLLAFTLLWLHSMSGVFEESLRKMFNFDAFVHWSSLVILVSILLHPLLLLASINFDLLIIFGSHPLPIWLGAIGLTLLLTYDIGKLLKRHEFFQRHWQDILTISTIGFLLIFFHSLQLGSDLQGGFLRKLWVFYGVTAILATIYTYGIKRYTSRR